MAKGNFPACHEITAKWEGGWSDHSADPGGATMFGVTIDTLSKWRGRQVTKAEVKALKRSEAEQIYKAWYWDKSQGDLLPAGVDLVVYDFSVNSGPGRAAKYLQGASGVPQDGQIGPVTLAAVAKQNPVSLINSICDARLAFLRRLDTWPTFRKGWSSRVAGVRKEALRMAQEPSQPVPATSEPPKPQPSPQAPPKPALPTTPVVVHVNEDGSVNPGKAPEQPNTDNLFWRLLWAVLDLIFGRKKQ